MPRARYEYKHRLPQRRRIKVHLILIALVVLLLLAYPFVETRMLSTQTHTLQVANLPANLKNVKIVYASDFHQSGWFGQKQVNEVIHRLNNLSADIIILGGDYAMDSDGAIAFFEKMPSLHARLGVYGVLGNHDRTLPESNLQLLMDAMKNKGVTPLVNSVSRVKVGQSYLYIAGVDDFYNGTPDVKGVAAQVREEDFVIFAGHTPDLIPDAQKAKDMTGDGHWFDLALFGHTHGGQINLFGWTPFRNVSEELSARYISGWREENRAAMLISNGVGTSVFPARLFAPPQVHLITLKTR
ncbi:MAG: metallophosphoesterase [Clostridia bacterium]|nr:metallophosphoesterase [Clostridia bacterium]